MSVREGVRVETALILISSVTKREQVFNMRWNISEDTKEVCIETTKGGAHSLFKLRGQRVLGKNVERDPLEAEQQG